VSGTPDAADGFDEVSSILFFGSCGGDNDPCNVFSFDVVGFSFSVDANNVTFSDATDLLAL
jgi:hypothetical protein